MIYSHSFYVNSHDEDYRGMLRASAVQKYMQECANCQLRELGPSNEELRAEGKAFLLSRISVDIQKTPTAYEEILGRTWSCESKGYSFYRCHELWQKDELICRAHSVWAMIDIKTKKLLRACEFKPGFDHSPMPQDMADTRILMPHTDEMQEVGKHTVTYHEADINHHLNNTCYPDLFFDLLPHDGKRIRSYTISFMNEAPLHDTLTLYRKTGRDGGELMCSIRSDGRINAEAKLFLCSAEG